ncbi:MAG: hypothetical protein JXR81_05480 [Candidatus Goldbacteria bacterium]|nr:hypothetical protein [Candidatus Goldiibacteriota bacterium]
MKKLICSALIFSLITAGILGSAKPAFAATAAEEDAEATKFALLITAGVLGVVALIVLADSAGREELAKAEKVRLDALAVSNNEKLDKWTFDDMLAEYGKPTEITEGDTIKIAVYDERVATVVENTEYQSATFLSNATSQSYANTLKNGVLKTFIFDKKTKKLTKWRYQVFRGGSAITDRAGQK